MQDSKDRTDREKQAIIRMEGVRKMFGELCVLDGLTVSIPASQKVALIGPSGSGKSTILRVLMTLEAIDAGEVFIEEENLWKMSRKGREVAADTAHLSRIRNKVGMVFQQFNLFPHMNVLRNVTEAPVHVLGLEKQEARERAMDLLKLVGLADKVDSFPAQLSGGQKQRVAIARALAMRPKIMLFDEVTSALDPELVGEVLGVLRELARSTDMTMLIVTHQMNFAQDIADRVLFLERGRILEDNRPEVIFTRPEQERTQKFLRSILDAR